MAAEQSSTHAHLKLGDYYYYGMGVEKNLLNAAYHYRLASELRSPQVSANLALLLLPSSLFLLPLPLFLSKSLTCSDGLVQAAFNIGYMHQWGEGLPKDPHLAKRYYDLAVELGPEEAYLPAKISLYLLYACNHISYLQGKQPLLPPNLGLGGGTVFGLQWDTLLILFLSCLLLLTMVIRYLLLHHNL